MTRDQAKKILRNLPFVRAWANNESVQYFNVHTGEWHDLEHNPNFEHKTENYRIKPAEPLVRYHYKYWSLFDCEKVVVSSSGFTSYAEAERVGRRSRKERFIAVVKMQEAE